MTQINNINRKPKHMAFTRHKGLTKTKYFPRPASQTFTKGDLVYTNGSGQVIPADATSGRHVGVIKKTVATTDDDYATADVLVPIEVPVERWVEWKVTAVAAVANDILEEIDLTDAGAADRSASSKDALLVTGFVSATVLIVVILSTADNRYTGTT